MAMPLLHAMRYPHLAQTMVQSAQLADKTRRLIGAVHWTIHDARNRRQAALLLRAHARELRQPPLAPVA
jgi:hypothetical protein